MAGPCLPPHAAALSQKHAGEAKSKGKDHHVQSKQEALLVHSNGDIVLVLCHHNGQKDVNEVMRRMTRDTAWMMAWHFSPLLNVPMVTDCLQRLGSVNRMAKI